MQTYALSQSNSICITFILQLTKCSQFYHLRREEKERGGEARGGSYMQNETKIFGDTYTLGIVSERSWYFDENVVD